MQFAFQLSRNSVAQLRERWHEGMRYDAIDAAGAAIGEPGAALRPWAGAQDAFAVAARTDVDAAEWVWQSNGPSGGHTPLRSWSAGVVSGDDSSGLGGCICMGCMLTKSSIELKTVDAVTLAPDTNAPRPEFLGDDIADDISSTTRLNVGQTLNSSISPAGDLDFVRVAVVQGQTYAVSLSTVGLTAGLADTYLELRDANGALITEDDDGGIRFDSYLFFTAQTTGDVFLVARSFVGSGQPATTGNYALSINTITGGNTSPTVFSDNGKPFFSWDEAGIQITRSGASWSNDFGQSTIVTYAYRATSTGMPTEGEDGIGGFTQFTANQIEFTEQAFAAWSDVANITFQRVGSGTSGPGAFSDDATILIGGYTTGSPGAAAFAYLPSSNNRTFGSVQGDIWVNVSQSANANMVFGGYGPHTMLHEIGHAIGLSHPSIYNADENASPNYLSNAAYFGDSRMFSTMSYFGSGSTQGNLSIFSAAPQMHDIAAAQRLYGANMNTRTGDSVYGFNSNTGLSQFTATSGSSGVVFAVWDAGGVDTFDFSGFSQNASIDLRAEAFSSAGPGSSVGSAAIFNIGIARGVVIENATTGAGDDFLRGNAVANVLNGGAGFDSLMGMEGDDILIGGSAGDQLNGGEGFDFASYQTSTFAVVADLGTPANNQLDAAGDVYTSIEGLIGSSGGDTLTGNASANTLIGDAGNDVLFGLGGDDTLFGGDNNDQLTGGAGFDVVDGGAGTDQAFTAGLSTAHLLVAFNGLTMVVDAATRVFDRYTNVETYVFDNTSVSQGAVQTVNAFDYLASYSDLLAAFGSNVALGFQHYATDGFFEGRAVDLFKEWDYLAGYDDLILALAGNSGIASQHYVNHGFGEGRSADRFQEFQYLATYDDLIAAFGSNPTIGAQHFVTNGFAEGRIRDGFDGFQYIASHADLIVAFGPNDALAAQHFVTNGFAEGRARDTFDAVQYLANYADLQAAYGADLFAVTMHYITNGFFEGRTDDPLI